VVVNELNSIPNVSHEGLRFNHAGTALYFVDEDHSGSIYKFVPSVKGDYSQGQSFVLAVDAYTGAPETKGADAGDRTGMASWVALTDADGVAVTSADPFDNASRGGRAAADEIGGTPFDRPEDVEVGYLRNGHEVLYFNATSEQAVYSVEELGNGMAMVRLAACEADTPKNLGYAGTTGHLSSPDNLAQDALGNIYVVEDKPNGDNIGGDVWFLRDANGDGVAESLDHFMSLQVKGAENTGMIFRPGHPTQFIINVQHPESTGDEINGQGDATWLLDLKDVVAPPCAKDDDHHHHHHHGHSVKTCSDSHDVNFVKKLIKAGK
jgi:secreted PhoX family phosphatase